MDRFMSLDEWEISELKLRIAALTARLQDEAAMRVQVSEDSQRHLDRALAAEAERDDALKRLQAAEAERETWKDQAKGRLISDVALYNEVVAERDDARRRLRAAEAERLGDLRKIRADEHHAMTRERAALEAARDDLLKRWRKTWLKWLDRDTNEEESLFAALFVDVRAALAATPEPEAGGPCACCAASGCQDPATCRCSTDPQPPAAVRERVELRVQRRPDGRPNTEPAAMLCLRDVDNFGRRRTRFVATVAPEYIEALDAALRAVQGGE